MQAEKSVGLKKALNMRSTTPGIPVPKDAKSSTPQTNQAAPRPEDGVVQVSGGSGFRV